VLRDDFSVSHETKSLPVVRLKKFSLQNVKTDSDFLEAFPPKTVYFITDNQPVTLN
jgi:hypothetical protein